MIKIIKLWAPVLIWAGLIFYLSSIPGLKSNFKFDFVLRKIAHVTEYLILTFLLRRAFKGSFSLNDFQLFIYPAIFAVLYAASDEFHQLFIPQRHGCIKDIFIDSIGVFGFYMVLKGFLMARKK